MVSRTVRRRTRPAEPVILTGLDGTPAPDAAASMAAFDQLPPRVQRALDRSPWYFKAQTVLREYKGRGEAGVLSLIARSEAEERRRFSGVPDHGIRRL